MPNEVKKTSEPERCPSSFHEPSPPAPEPDNFLTQGHAATCPSVNYGPCNCGAKEPTSAPQQEEACNCESHSLAPLYHRPGCPKAPKERASAVISPEEREPSAEALEMAGKFIDAWRSVIRSDKLAHLLDAHASDIRGQLEQAQKELERVIQTQVEYIRTREAKLSATREALREAQKELTHKK